MKKVDEGIFLFRTTYSETSLIATFYTKSSGLKKCIFKGGKKKAHSLFPLSTCEITYFERNDSDLATLVESNASLPATFQFDPIRSSVAFFIAEVVRKCIETHEPDIETYIFLKETIKNLENKETIASLPIEFMLGFARVLGIQPIISGINPSFNFADGTLGESKGTVGAEGPEIRLIIETLNGTFSHDSKAVRSNALKVMIDYFAYHIPRMEKLDSLEIIKEVIS